MHTDGVLELHSLGSAGHSVKAQHVVAHQKVTRGSELEYVAVRRRDVLGLQDLVKASEGTHALFNDGLSGRGWNNPKHLTTQFGTTFSQSLRMLLTCEVHMRRSDGLLHMRPGSTEVLVYTFLLAFSATLPRQEPPLHQPARHGQTRSAAALYRLAY